MTAGEVNAAQSMARHTRLITSLLHLDEELLSIYGLVTNPHTDSQAMIQAALMHGPMLGEALGLLRGQGSGVLAQGSLQPEHRGSLRALHQRVAELMDASDRSMERAMALNPGYRAALSDRLQQQKSLTAAALQLASDSVIEAQELNLAPPQYFDTLTQAIQAVNALSLQGLRQLDLPLQAQAGPTSAGSCCGPVACRSRAWPPACC